jgi:hypothetical protein
MPAMRSSRAFTEGAAGTGSRAGGWRCGRKEKGGGGLLGGNPRRMGGEFSRSRAGGSLFL